MSNLEDEVCAYGQKLAPLIFGRLYRLIDHDLLFTTEPDLVWPKIRDVCQDVLSKIAPRVARDTTTATWMIDILARETWIYTCSRRPKTS